jgi:ketosteroid isomerase-like protein
LRLQPDGPAVSGRAAIEKLFVQNFQGAWKGTKLTLKAERTQEVAPNVRIQAGSYEVSGGTAGPQRGRYLNTAVREGNDWRLASVAPIPETPAK